MKLSQFTIIVPDLPSEGKYLVYNIFNQATAVIGEKSKGILTNLQQEHEDDAKYIKIFEKMGFIVDDSVDEGAEFKDWYNAKRYSKSIIRATILTTYDCNFACEYCVEEGIKKPIRMDEEHCRRTLDWLISKAKRDESEKILLQFYGGEPLMNTAPIEYIASGISKYSKENDVSFNFTITTNGSLLKPELVDRLLPLGLEYISVTLDGDREAHNSKRPFRSGKGSFDVVIENLLQVADKTKIRIGSNIDERNAESVPRMLDYLEQVGLKDKIDLIKFNPIVRIEGQDGASLSSRQTNCAPPSKDWPLENLIKLTWEAYNRGFKTESRTRLVICSMNLDGAAVVIDPMGNIYTCPAFVGREGFQSGDIYHEELFDSHQEFMNIEIPDDCFKCTYMPICNGGCKHMAYAKYGDLKRTVCEKDYLQKITVELLRMQVLTQKIAGNKGEQ